MTIFQSLTQRQSTKCKEDCFDNTTTRSDVEMDITTIDLASDGEQH